MQEQEIYLNSYISNREIFVLDSRTFLFYSKKTSQGEKLKCSNSSKLPNTETFDKNPKITIVLYFYYTFCFIAKTTFY